MALQGGKWLGGSSCRGSNYSYSRIILVNHIAAVKYVEDASRLRVPQVFPDCPDQPAYLELFRRRFRSYEIQSPRCTKLPRPIAINPLPELPPGKVCTVLQCGQRMRLPLTWPDHFGFPPTCLCSKSSAQKRWRRPCARRWKPLDLAFPLSRKL